MKNMTYKHLGLLFILATVGCVSEPTKPAVDTEAKISPAVSEKLDLRGKNEGIRVEEFRAQTVNGTYQVQADFINTLKYDRTVFYRFHWLNEDGNQVGDDEVWKQMKLYGQQRKTVKGVGIHNNTSDFRLEWNVEPN